MKLRGEANSIVPGGGRLYGSTGFDGFEANDSIRECMDDGGGGGVDARRTGAFSDFTVGESGGDIEVDRTDILSAVLGADRRGAGGAGGVGSGSRGGGHAGGGNGRS